MMRQRKSDSFRAGLDHQLTARLAIEKNFECAGRKSGGAAQFQRHDAFMNCDGAGSSGLLSSGRARRLGRLRLFYHQKGLWHSLVSLVSRPLINPKFSRHDANTEAWIRSAANTARNRPDRTELVLN